MNWTRALGHLRHPPRLSKADWALLILPAAAWIGLFQLREHVISPRCSETPALCQPESVFAADRPAIGLASSGADRLSFWTQYGAGSLAVAAPLTWNTVLWMTGRLTPAGLWISAFTDLVILTQASLWNGAVTEGLRLLVQRPRPFVYSDPTRLGVDASHYTSFVSGHTSFAAVAGVTLVLLLLGRGAPRQVLIPLAGAAFSLVLLTGLFRILAGRHFMTDVLAATLSGSLVALWIAWIHRPRPS